MNRQLIILQLLSIGLLAIGQPAPGDLYKEYRWFNEPGDCSGALRVGELQLNQASRRSIRKEWFMVWKCNGRALCS